jgi:hypothetical protein
VGCVPFFVEKQPSIAFDIHGEDGRPLSGATLHFARIPVCLGCVYHTSWLDHIPADDEGRVAVHWYRAIQWALMAPDGGPVTYAWTWCIDRDGYEPAIQGQFGPKQVKPVVSVTLIVSRAGRKCIWRNNREFVSAVL